MKYTSCGRRIYTDAEFLPPAGSSCFRGKLADAIKFVENAQLTDPSLWKLFVDQFRIGNVDDADLGWRGEYWGKMMRGACFTYSYTQNRELYSILCGTVRDLLSVQDGKGRIASYSEENEFRGWDMWSRKYVMLGLEYFLEICEDDTLSDSVVAALKKHADYITEKIGNGEGKTPITETSSWWGGMNSSSITEPFVRLYFITGEEKYLDFAGYIIGEGGIKGFDLFGAALEDRLFPYQYPVTKAYEMISCFEGVLEYYRATGEEKYKAMAVRFAKRVMDSDITVIGSAGTTHELFDHSAVHQFDPAFKGIMQETCVTVTWMKFCHRLLCLTGDPVYADQIERSAFNALLGAINFEGHKTAEQFFAFDSYSPLLNGVRGRAVGGYKDIIKNTFYWGCCVAIGAAGTALVPMTAVMPSKNGIAVNLFSEGTAETVLTDGNIIKTDIVSDYPRSGKVTLKITPEREERFAVSVRIPSWSRDTSLSVNDNGTAAEAGSYAVIDRVWSEGDVISLSLDMRTEIIRASSVDPEADADCACHVCLRRGPLVLARDSAFGEDITLPVTVTDVNGYASVTEEKDSGSHTVLLRVKTEEGSFLAADYASCGRSRDPSLPMTAWITVK